MVDVIRYKAWARAISSLRLGFAPPVDSDKLLPDATHKSSIV